MKRILSVLLALVMVVGTCTALVTTASAATNTTVPKVWNFDESSLSGKTDAALLSSIGWTDLNGTSGLKASIKEGTLHLQNPTGSSISLLMCDNELLKEAYTIQYDFKYSAKSDLSNGSVSIKVGNTTKEYTQYNEKTDESAHFSGAYSTGDSSTWHVQPRINGQLLNSPKNNDNGWVDTTKMTPTYASTVLEQWFTMRIDYSSEDGVSVFVKPRGAAEWSRTDSYSPETLAKAKTNSSGFVTQYLRLTLRCLVDVCLDNISIDNRLEKSWDFEGVTGSGTALLNSLGWSVLSGEAGLSASIEDGALHLRNAKDERIYMLVCQDRELRGSYTIQYDFKYATASDLPEPIYKDAEKTEVAYSQYNTDTDEAGFFIGDDGGSSAGTWQVQPRLNAGLLNSAKTDGDGWIDTTMVSYVDKTEASSAINNWFTMKIEYSSGNNVTVSIKAKGAADWAYTEEFSDKEKTQSIGTDGFITEYLRFCVAHLVDVYVDNITITGDDYAPEIYGLQMQDDASENLYMLRAVSTIKDKLATKVGYRFIIKYFDEATGGIRKAHIDKDCAYVYKSITFKEDDVSEPVTRTADALRPGTSYIYALHLNDVPMDETYTYQIIPYEERDGKVIYGKGITYDRSLAKEKLPKYYDTDSSENVNFIEFCAGGYYTRQIEGTTPDEFNKYVEKLGDAGYTLYQNRDDVNGNYFRTFYNGYMMVHLYYMPVGDAEGVVRIVVSDTGLEDAFKKEADGDARVTEGSMTLMAPDYEREYQGDGGVNGLGVIFTNPDGSYVIADGAWDSDAATLFNFLKDNNKRADGKIIIRAWIITHPHEDHWGNFVEFSKKFASEVELEYFVGQLNQQYCNANSQVYTGSAKIRAAAARFRYGDGCVTKTIVPQTGQVMYFGALQVEFLYTFETLLNPSTVASYSSGGDGNEQSLMFRAQFTDANGAKKGQSVVVTGDAQGAELPGMEAMYEDHLNSDFITLPHHGLNATTATFYDKINPTYVLVPVKLTYFTTNYERYRSYAGGMPTAVEKAIANGGAYFVADGGYATFGIENTFEHSFETPIPGTATGSDSTPFEDFFKSN